MKSWPFLLLMCAALAACSDNGCRNTVVASDRSPDGLRVATTFERDCGATTDFATSISITRKDVPIAGVGNVFVADSDHGAAAPSNNNGPWAETRWLSADHLLVRYDAKARVFTHAASQDGVTVSYEPLAR